MAPVIAVTGGTGFVGGALIQRLEGRGCQVRALVRPTSRGPRRYGPGVHWMEGDLGDLDSLRRLVRGAEMVVHCAGVLRGATLEDFRRVNVAGIARLLGASVEQQPKPRFLLMSSLAAREPEISAYAASKRQGEEVLAAEAGEMDWAVLRPPAVYGPGDRELRPLLTWIGRGFAPVLGPENARFSLLYVEDLADAVIRWLECEDWGRGAFELHDGRPGGYSWSDVIDTIAHLRRKSVFRVRVPVAMLRLLAAANALSARVAGYSPMLTSGKVREFQHLDWVCDNAAIRSETGWSPRVSLEEGLRRSMGWHS